MIMICQCRFNRYEMLIVWEAVGGGGADRIWELFVFTAAFCYEPKTALKNKTALETEKWDPGL